MNLPNVWRYTFCLFGFEVFLGAFRFLDWNQGPARAALLGLVMLLLLAIRYWPPRLVSEERNSGRWNQAIVGLVAVTAAWSISMIVLAVTHTVKTGEIRLDQGQNVYRAAIELWRGRNPYGQGALLDLYSYRLRMEKRVAAGLGPTIPVSAVEPELERYWDTLNPAIRNKLLPSVPPNGPASARREISVLGYKYGPVPLLMTAALTPILGPAAVPVTNGAACLALFVFIALILDRAGAGPTGAGLALSAVMIDPWITFSYIRSSASDVWPLLFGFAAVLCAMRRWDTAFGLSLALALGSKLFPAVLYLPLLITVRSLRATVAFGAALIALFLPWAIWDAFGFFHNFIYWVVLVDGDTTSWTHYAARNIVVAVRVLLGVLVAFLTYKLVSRQERRWGWALAAITLSVLAAGSVFHNNYIPWFSTWVVVAVVESFYVRRQHIYVHDSVTKHGQAT